jgi:hypothetical protein
MAVTIDPRPSYFGDRMIVTGSYEAGDTSIDLSDLLASIDFAGINPSAAQSDLTTSDGTSTDIITLVDSCTVSGTTITLHSAISSLDPDGGGAAPAVAGQTLAGTFIAIGRRS